MKARSEILSFVFLTVILISNSTLSQQWVTVQSPNPSNVGNYFAGVGSVSSNDVWAVGAYDTISGILQWSRSLTEHWNGTSWTQVPSPNPGLQYNQFNAVHGFTSNNVYAVGYEAGIPAVPQMLITHWNGAAWSLMNTPVIQGGAELRCILAFAPNDIYAGGSKNFGAPGPDVGTLVVHWNGTTWDTLTTPNQSNRSNFITDMGGLSTDDFWAVGYSRPIPEPFRILILHKTGSNWNVISVPLNFSESFLYSVDVITSNNIWATGEYNDNGTLFPLFLHYNGSSWSVVSSPAGGHGTIHNSASDIWSTNRAFVHYDGNSWSSVNTVIPSGGILRNTSRISSTDMWAVGEYFDAGIRKTLTMHMGSPTAIEPAQNEIPTRSSLAQNYPNPFNPSTIIKYNLHSGGLISLRVYNIIGDEIAVLENGFKAAGSYEARFNGANLSSGVYFYRIKTNEFTDTKKMLLVK